MATNTFSGSTASTSTTLTSNGTTGPYQLDFEYSSVVDVEVFVGGVLKTRTTDYTFTSNTQITFTTGNAPANGAIILIQRNTLMNTVAHVFSDGSVLTATELNNINKQVVHGLQELIDDYIKRDGSQTIKANLVFEGSTENDNETTLAITNPTQDNTITLPDRTGTVITSGDTGTVSNTILAGNSVDSSKIVDGSIVNADINASAAISGSKLQAASTSNAGSMSSSDKTKLDNIETAATADQTADEIRTAVEAASDSNVFTDADHTKLNSAATLTDAQTLTNKTLTSPVINDASGTAIVTSGTSTSDNKFYSAKRAGEIFYGKDTLEEIQSGETWSAADTKIATTAAIDARIIDFVDDVGGFNAIANETSFPATNPQGSAGQAAILSIASVSTTLTPGSNTITIANGAGTGNTVTINNVTPSSVPQGFGLIVESTSTLHTYNFHRLVPKATEVSTVAAISGNVTTVAGISSNVTTVANNDSNVTAVAGKATEIGRLGTTDAVADMALLGTTDAVADMNTLGTSSNVTNMNTLAGISSNITTVAGVSSNVTTVAGNNSNVTTVAGAITNVNSVAGSIASVNTAANNLTSINNFGDKYQVASSNPSTDGGGNSLAEGDLYFNTTANELKIYNGGAWQGGVTASGNFAATTGNTFTGDNVYADNAKAIFGTGSDLKIHHSSNQSTIEEINGSLNITSNGALSFNPSGSNVVTLVGNATKGSGQIKLNCEQNSHGIILKGPPHSAAASYTLTLPNNIVNGNFLTTDANGNTSWAAIDLTALNGSNLTSGTIPDARFPATLPAISGANLTNLDAADLSSGTIPAARFATDTIATDSLAAGALPTDVTVASANIVDGTIVNDDINASAAIAGTKVTPSFGSQDLSTSGSAATGALTVTGNVTVTGTVDGVDIAGLNTTVSNLSLSGSTLANGTTATTQSAGDASTKVATTAYTDTAITNLIDSSPSALNTLNELAAALGDDANFSTTVTNSIATKLANIVEDSSPQLGGALDTNGNNINIGDSGSASDDRLVIGAGSDLQIFHQPNNSFIDSSNGTLNIRAFGSSANDGIVLTGNNDILIKVNGGDDSAKFIGTGAVELYHNNSKKFETTSTGVSIDGNISAGDNDHLYLGDSQDINIYHDGTDNYFYLGTGTTYFRNASNAFLASFVSGGPIYLYHNGNKKFETSATGVSVTGALVASGNISGGETLTVSGNAPNITFTDTDHNPDYKIYTDSGNLYIYDSTNNSNRFIVNSDGHIDVAGNLDVGSGLDVTGAIVASGNVTAYSDARLKTDISTINDALGIVGKLRGVSYKWIKDGKPSIGVIAQEVEEVIPEVVLTNVNTDPATGEETEVKSVDYGKIVGVLINAINELKAEVDELKGGK